MQGTGCPRMAARRAVEILVGFGEQTIIVAGTNTAGFIINRLAAQLVQLTAQRADIEVEIITVIDAHSLTEVPTSTPGSGVSTAARILTEVVGNLPTFILCAEKGSRPYETESQSSAQL